MTDVPSYLDRSVTAFYGLQLQVGADEDQTTIGEAVASLLTRAMLHRAPAVALMRPDGSMAVTQPDADQMLADALQPMTAVETNTFRLLKAHARADDGRMLLVRVHHQGRNRALIVLASPVGDGSVDLHALAMLADADMLAEVTPTN